MSSIEISYEVGKHIVERSVQEFSVRRVLVATRASMERHNTQSRQSHLHRLGSEREWASSMPYHAVLGFLIPLLISVLQVTNQGTNKYSFETHPANLWTFLLATLVYCFAFAANIRSQLCNSNYTQLSSLVAVISGTLSSVCLLTLFLPSLPGCLIFIIWACVLLVVSRNFIMIIYRWICQMIMKTLFLVFGLWNRFKGSNLVEQPRLPV